MRRDKNHNILECEPLIYSFINTYSGEVIAVSPKEGKVIVKKVNIVTKHVKPRKMGDQGGLIEVESALYASKVQLVCPKCGKATRVGHKDGKRVCKQCAAEF